MGAPNSLVFEHASSIAFGLLKSGGYVGFLSYRMLIARPPDRRTSFRWNRWGGSAGCNPNLDLPPDNPIYPITMPDRRPQFEQDWLESVWVMVIILAILFLRYVTRR
jgi:hypothetical protein